MDSLRRWTTGWVFFIGMLIPASLHAEELIRHELKMVIQPDKNHLQVEDTITLPESFLAVSGRKLHFLLHNGLQPVSPTAGVKGACACRPPFQRQRGTQPVATEVLPPRSGVRGDG